MPQSDSVEVERSAITPPFDRERLLELVDSDRDLLREIVRLFVEDAPGWLESIRSAASELDGERLYAAAHALRGASINFAADRAAAIALKLESLGRSGEDLASAGDLAKQLDLEVATLVDELQREASA